MAHDAFISYSRKDKDFAMRLHKALADYVPPKDLPVPQRRLDVFRDADDFTGAEYYQSLDRHLGSSGKLIVVCSPAARGSQFVNDEIQRFARHKGAENIIALLVAGIPNNEAAPDQQAQMAFPDALCEVMKMPLAADYRGFDPKRSRVDRGSYEATWYTTLANILDVSRAQIEQREKKRRVRRRQISVAIGTASVIVLTGLSLTAWKQRQDAVRQEAVAAARFLTAQAVGNESRPSSEGLRLRALIAAESLRKSWSPEGYSVWRRATLQMPPVQGRIETDSMLIGMAFTADGKQLFALCGDRHIHVFSVPDLREVKKIEVSQTASELTIDSGGAHALAYQANDESLEIVDVANGTKKSVFLPASFQSAAFNSSGEALVLSLTNLWVLGAGPDEVHSRIAFPAGVSSVALSPDGASALALTDSLLVAYDTGDGKVRWQRSLSRENGREVSFNGDGQLVMIRSSRELSIARAATGEQENSFPAEPEQTGRAFLFRNDAYALGNEVYKTSGTTPFVLDFEGEPGTISTLPVASPSGRYVAGILRSEKQSFAVIDLATGADGASIYLTLQDGYQGMFAAFTQDGNLLALSSRIPGLGGEQPSDLQLVSLKRESWRPVTPSRSRTGDLNVLPPDSRVVGKSRTSPALRTFDANGTSVADDGHGTFVSPSGRFAARLDTEKGWIVTDTNNKKRITLPGNESTLEYSPDEQRALVFPDVYSLDNPATPKTLAVPKSRYQTWTYPGSPLVIGVAADSVGTEGSRKSVLFDWKTGDVSEGPGSVYSAYAVSPDGEHFVTYDHDVILLWKTGTAEPIARSGGAVVEYDTPMYFSPDGTLLAVSKCRSVPLYDASSLELRFQVPIGNSCFAGFSLDGKYVVSRAWHDEIPEPTLHPITIEGVLEETCSKVLDNLSEREWQRIGVAAINTCPDRGR